MNTGPLIPVVAAALAMAITPAHAQQTAAVAGREVFVRECAPCHGDAATGDGTASRMLKQRPPDLTRLTDRTVPFPTEKIRNQLTGRIRLVPSHGRPEMPLWRDALEGPAAGTTVSELDALLAYLEAIQLREFGRYRGPSAETIAAAGKPLFETHCAACHGRDGRGRQATGDGAGPAADLTEIAARNGGTFELRKVYESIARCGAHWRPSAMPAWRKAMTRAGWSDYVTSRHLEALATYVESIQR